MEPLAHVTCVNSTMGEVEEAIDKLNKIGVENILALRGDRIEGQERGEFNYCTGLIPVIKRLSNADIGAACYPEGHPESRNMVEDIRNLKKKVDLGVTHLNTQLFFDNDVFLNFMDKVRLAGIDVPVQAGIMPLVKKSQFGGIVRMTGAGIPTKIARMYARFADDPQSLEDGRGGNATNKRMDILAAGGQGIHRYIMNNARVARRITENIKPILDRINSEDRS